MADEREVSPRQRGMTPLVVTLSAGVPKAFDLAGDWFHVQDAPVDDLVVRFDDGEPVKLYQGMGVRRYYQRVELESATGQSVRVLVGFGSVVDGRSTANVNVTANVAPGNTVDDGGDVSCTASAATKLADADTDRLYLVVCAPSANVNTMRIGTSAVDGSSGILLEPGEKVAIATTAAVYAYNTDDNGGGAESLTVAAVKQV